MEDEIKNPSESLNDISLNIESADITVSIARASLGLIPFVGRFLGEITGYVIPNQRMERLSKFITILGKRLESLEEATLQSLLLDNNFQHLFEESCIQAVRAVTDERREYISSIVFSGIKKDRADFLQSIHLLQLFSDLNDVEILWLKKYELLSNMKYENHPVMEIKSLQPIATYMGASSELLEAAAIQESYKEHLCRLGLVVHKYRINSKTKTPEYDSHGKKKIDRYEITTLGEMLLSYIGILET